MENGDTVGLIEVTPYLLYRPEQAMKRINNVWSVTLASQAVIPDLPDRSEESDRRMDSSTAPRRSSFSPDFGGLAGGIDLGSDISIGT